MDNPTIEKLFRNARIKGRPSESSLNKYKESIERFAIAMKIKSIEEVTMEHFASFTEKMRRQEVTDSYIANVISAMRWILAGYIKENGKLNDIADVEDILRPAVKKQPIEYLTEAEVQKFLESINDDLSKGTPVRKARFLALIGLLIHSGARIGEVLSIDRADINREGLIIPVIGKGRIKRDLLLTKGTLKLVDDYLAMRSDDSPALFTALGRKTRWQQTDVNRTFKRYRELSGINKRFTNHTLRHTFATILEKRGVPLTDIQVLLGHKNLRTTIEYYIGASSFERARASLEDKHFNFIPSSGDSSHFTNG